jgi:hypothetical protein
MKRNLYLVAILITLLAAFLRFKAVKELPIDYDELTYLPDGFRYEEMIEKHKWAEIVAYDESMEHPAFNKLLFAIDLRIRNPKEPDWEPLSVGQKIPPADQAAFFGPRLISAVGGTLQILITSLVNPIGGLMLALNTYHIKYSAQVYLEGIPGFMTLLSVFLFEFAVPKKDSHDVAHRWNMLMISAAALGVAAAGKYLYGIVGFVMLAFLVFRTRSWKPCVGFCFTALAVFFIADPFLWSNPPLKLWNSLTFHWHFAHSDHVKSAGMPWFAPIVHLLRPAPTYWHPGVFYTGIADRLLLPLALVGVVRALRERPIWVAWAAFGLIILLFWPTKWPQYILIVLPPLTVCAGFGVQQIFQFFKRLLVKPVH